VEYGFTAKMEDDLDEIADGHEAWVPVLDRFWKEFKQRVDHVDDTVTREDVSEAREPAPASAHGLDHAAGGTRALQAAAHGREHAGRSCDPRRDRSLRAVRAVRREEVRLDQGRRSVHRRA